MQLFQYAVIFEPTAEQKKDGVKAEIIVPVTTVLANDSQSATIMAGREIPEKYLGCLDQVKLVTRPF